MPRGVPFTKEECEKIARSCSTWLEMFQKYRGVLNKAYKHGWIKDYTWLHRDRRPHNSLTEKECRRIAKRYKSVKEFMLNDMSAYVTASKNGWLETYKWLVRGRPRTRKEIAALAVKFSTKKDFHAAYPAEYKYAYRHGWLNNFKWLTKAKHGPKNNEENYG